MRIAIVYGKYDWKYVCKGFVLSRIYEHLGEDLKWLWTKDLKTNTVHVGDVARALWDVCEWQSNGKPGWDVTTMGATPIFNVVDHTDTDQGLLADYISQIYSIKTGFVGQIMSTFARMNMDNVLEDINEHVMGPWADLLAAANITRPGPINPFMEKELFKDENLCLNGSRLEEVVGFKYDRPLLRREDMEEMIESFKAMNWWP